MKTEIVWGSCVHTDGTIEKSTHITFEDEKEMWDYYDTMRVIEGSDISVKIYNLSIVIGQEYVPVQEYRIAKGHDIKLEDREDNCAEEPINNEETNEGVV
jgi:hypothetical protein